MSPIQTIEITGVRDHPLQATGQAISPLPVCPLGESLLWASEAEFATMGALFAVLESAVRKESSNLWRPPTPESHYQ